jgi:WS/DGAT/MGAT family acyltransferase
MFLQFERPNAHMHVGATLLFDGGPLRTADGRVDARRIRQHIGAHLWAIPRYRQRLHPSPIDGLPVWVDDTRFDLAAHVRHVRLERPGDEHALRRLASRILSQPLDRNRPLWEIWIIDGLADGRVAVVNKTHHCMVDGVAGADLLTILLSPTPAVDTPPAPEWIPHRTPSAPALLRDRIARQASAARAVVSELWRTVRAPGRLAQWTRYGGALWQAVGLGLWPAPDSPFNRPIGPRRRFAWTAVDLGEVKEVKNRLGGTVNDVVLATVAGAVRRFLRRRDPDGRPADLRALVPVNTRTGAEASAMGNHVAAWLMPLPVGQPDPRRRLARIRATTAALKEANEALGAELLSAAGSTVLALGVRLVERLRPFNLVVTNVPGPPLPLYFLGARLQHIYPLVPLFPNQGLGVAVFSYADTLCWGFNADCHVVPDVDALAEDAAAAFRELAAAARSEARDAQSHVN